MLAKSGTAWFAALVLLLQWKGILAFAMVGGAAVMGGVGGMTLPVEGSATPFAHAAAGLPDAGSSDLPVESAFKVIVPFPQRSPSATASSRAQWARAAPHGAATRAQKLMVGSGGAGHGRLPAPPGSHFFKGAQPKHPLGSYRPSTGGS